MVRGTRVLSCGALLSFVLLGASACSAAADEDADVGDTSESAEALTSGCATTRAKILASASGKRLTAIQRGFTWLDARVPYSQSAYHGGYRTDCSGFVSMSWQLGTSYTTVNFNDGSAGVRNVAYNDLVPADALVRRSGGAGHIVMFLAWDDAAKTKACVIEQASTASDMQFRMRTVASLKQSGFKAIRSNKLAANGLAAEEEEDEP